MCGGLLPPPTGPHTMNDGLQAQVSVDFRHALGHGAFGNVFAATWASGRPKQDDIAIKSVDAWKLSQKARAQLHREVELHSRVEHKNILRCYGAYETTMNSKQVHLVVARAVGDLGSAMLCGASAAVKLLAPRLLGELLRALAYLHDECNIVHADVKPSNCLITSAGVLQLCDLGGAARIDGHRGGRTTLVGSPAYTAPEVVAITTLGLDLCGASYSTPSDLWSAGVVLVELLSGGTMPFAAVPREPTALPAAVMFKPPRLEPEADFSRVARSLALRLLSKQPYLRPSAAEALDEYKSYFRGGDEDAGRTDESGGGGAVERNDEERSEAEESAVQAVLKVLAQREEEGTAALGAAEAPEEPLCIDDDARCLLSPPLPPPPPPDDSETDASPMSLPSWTSSMVDGGSPESTTP